MPLISIIANWLRGWVGAGIEWADPVTVTLMPNAVINVTVLGAPPSVATMPNQAINVKMMPNDGLSVKLMPDSPVSVVVKK